MRRDVCPGMKIKHKWHGRDETPEFNWHCVVKDIFEERNELLVTVVSATGSKWEETWDLDITRAGMLDGEYREIKDAD